MFFTYDQNFHISSYFLDFFFASDMYPRVSLVAPCNCLGIQWKANTTLVEFSKVHLKSKTSPLNARQYVARRYKTELTVKIACVLFVVKHWYEFSLLSQ